MIVAYVDKDELLDDFTLTIEFTDKPERGNEITMADAAKLILCSQSWTNTGNKVFAYMDEKLTETFKSIEKRKVNI